jgi:DNA-3-methyladenine glycosylase II
MEPLRSDPVMAELLDEHGPLELSPADDPFQRFVVAILRQQVSMASAEAIRERLFDSVEVAPRPILDADEAVLKEAGLSRQKVEYVRSVAEAFLERDYDRAYFAEMDDAAVVDELTAIRGVGDWTAKMFLLFCLGREDVFPVEDLGIRAAMRSLYDEEMSREAMVEHAARWRPYRSYASLYLWRATE